MHLLQILNLLGFILPTHTYISSLLPLKALPFDVHCLRVLEAQRRQRGETQILMAGVFDGLVSSCGQCVYRKQLLSKSRELTDDITLEYVLAKNFFGSFVRLCVPLKCLGISYMKERSSLSSKNNEWMSVSLRHFLLLEVSACPDCFKLIPFSTSHKINTASSSRERHKEILHSSKSIPPISLKIVKSCSLFCLEGPLPRIHPQVLKDFARNVLDVQGGDLVLAASVERRKSEAWKAGRTASSFRKNRTDAILGNRKVETLLARGRNAIMKWSILEDPPRAESFLNFAMSLKKTFGAKEARAFFLNSGVTGRELRNYQGKENCWKMFEKVEHFDNYNIFGYSRIDFHWLIPAPPLLSLVRRVRNQNGQAAVPLWNESDFLWSPDGESWRGVNDRAGFLTSRRAARIYFNRMLLRTEEVESSLLTTPHAGQYVPSLEALSAFEGLEGRVLPVSALRNIGGIFDPESGKADLKINPEFFLRRVLELKNVKIGVFLGGGAVAGVKESWKMRREGSRKAPVSWEGIQYRFHSELGVALEARKLLDRRSKFGRKVRETQQLLTSEGLFNFSYSAWKKFDYKMAAQVFDPPCFSSPEIQALCCSSPPHPSFNDQAHSVHFHGSPFSEFALTLCFSEHWRSFDRCCIGEILAPSLLLKDSPTWLGESLEDQPSPLGFYLTDSNPH